MKGLSVAVKLELKAPRELGGLSYSINRKESERATDGSGRITCIITHVILFLNLLIDI